MKSILIIMWIIIIHKHETLKTSFRNMKGIKVKIKIKFKAERINFIACAYNFIQWNKLISHKVVN